MNLIHFVAPMTAMGDSEDKRSFQFWIEQAAPLFSCYFGHSFWTQLLPQIGLVRPAVKHMLLVTSSVVENTALEGAPLDENQVYQSHYTKAIQATCSSPQVENVLLACLLFACCDFMRGSYESGLRHIRSGLSIIDEWYHSIQNSDLKASPSARLIINAIGPIFVSYVDKSPTYGFGDITVDTCACAGFLAPSLELPYIAPFNHIHGAHHALDGIAHYVARLMDWRKKSWTPAPPQKIQMLLDTWRITIDRFEANLTKAKKDAHAMILSYLRVYHTMFGVMIRASTGNSEAMYEKFDEEFKWIVDRYDDFANLWAEDDTLKFSSGTWANLDYHFGFIPPLFFTATKCRDPKTRMAALNHLGSLRVEEQNWTSCAAYVIAKKMIQIETNLSIINDRTGLRDERDLIRPIEAYITDKRMTQAGLDYAVHPFLKEEEPLTQHETIDLSECLALSSSSARWPLARILRIGGYQGGGIIPTPTNCHCHFHFQSSGTMLLYRPRT
ncbi:hypothetical protein PV08_01858 [Exophiala spinifera]|uniref:C6 zinc finger domain-containing protein n=1 Tax=Exophiala spinifera TaxID=91928 RepID=A0A0D2BQL2_9EURO|nr:uncharacterized protein PV08_01858 [Exophiala spinifera]KIW21278.1 hypothetical protein PV08_01858 [Exophiala spinifera]